MLFWLCYDICAVESLSSQAHIYEVPFLACKFFLIHKGVLKIAGIVHNLNWNMQRNILYYLAALNNKLDFLADTHGNIVANSVAAI